MFTRSLVCPTLVGRDEELQSLVDARLAASRGRGALVLLGGDAGIGKSRLLQAFRVTCAGGRAAVGTGHCREFGNAPYGALIEAFKAIGIVAPPSAPSRTEQLAEFVELLRTACAHRSVVLLIEDLHWADDGTLTFLQYALTAIPSLRLLVVATYRADAVERLERLDPFLARLARGRSTRRIDLKPLAPADLRHLIRLAAGPDRQLASAQLEEIVERSDGNPFFAEELLKHALEMRESGSTRELPATIRATVRERIAGLEPRERDVLTQASVLGRRFRAEFLAELCGLDLTGVLSTLRRFRDLQLIDEIAENQFHYAFRHALTRETVYSQILSAEARPIHARILRALESSAAANAHDLGFHAWAAGDEEKCVRYNERAGDEADAMHVYGDAIRCYERAVESAKDDESLIRLLVKEAVCCGRDGNAERSIDLYRRAIGHCVASGHLDRIAETYQAMSSQARVSGDTHRAMAILEDGLRAVPPEDAPGRAMLAASLAFMRLDRGQLANANALIAQSEAIKDSPLYYNARAYAAMVGGDLRAFRVISSEHIAACASLGAPELLRARFNLAFGLTILGADRDALEEFESILPSLQGSRLSSLQVLSYANLALIHGRAGRFAIGRELIDCAARIPQPATTGPIALAAAALTIGFALWDEEIVERCFSVESLTCAFSSGINSTLGRIAGPYARWLHARGNVAEAQSVLKRAVHEIRVPFGATETLIAAAEFGDEEALERVCELLGEIDALSGVEMYSATLGHLQALLALRGGRADDARSIAKDAALRYRAMGWAVHEAQCTALCGEHKSAASMYRKMRAPGYLRSMGGRDDAFSCEQTLSQRESEVASLVAAGTANKRIAERLAVNQRTVEKHLTSIYTKLGLRNRSELAAFMARRSP